MAQPSLSVIMLTWNEEGNVGRCLRSLANQTCKDFEVIVVDAASTDGTLDEIRAVEADVTFPMRLVCCSYRIAIGAARNLAVQRAKSPWIAFVSADAELERHWIEQARGALQTDAAVFSRQIHAPDKWSIGASVRGMRYHFPHGPTGNAVRYASNVAAAYHAEVLRRFPFDPVANAAEDLILARQAVEAGYPIRYNPDMVVFHHDVGAAKQEMKKCLREGRGCGQYARQLGGPHPILAWGGLLAAAAAVTFWSPAVGAVALGGAIWAPAGRRFLRRHHEIPLRGRIAGTFASPLFDLAFLGAYLTAVCRPRGRASQHPTPPEKETSP